MYFLALAVDYDGTIADHGRVSDATLDALSALKASGRALILVTGRLLADLQEIMPGLALFDRVVVENGGVLHDPHTGKTRVIAAPPSDALIARLQAAGAAPLSVGSTIIATWEPYHLQAFEAVHDLGLELEIIFNKGAVMILPTGVNKATGLSAALAELGLSPRATVGVGDAENDHSLFRLCGFSAAVANATTSTKAAADLVLGASNGGGVRELIERVNASDGQLLTGSNRGVTVAFDECGAERKLLPSDGNILIVGNSRAGKSTLAAGLIGRMLDQGSEVCVFDPEGDYALRPGLIPVGTFDEAPMPETANKLIFEAGISVNVNLHAVPVENRANHLQPLWRTIDAVRRQTGRPDWLIIDEAHQLFPVSGAAEFPSGLPATIFVTLDPDLLAPELVTSIKTLSVMGNNARSLITAFCRRAGCPEPNIPYVPDGHMTIWDVRAPRPVLVAKPLAPDRPHLRHAGKYAEGDVGWDRSFNFRGQSKTVDLRARNLFEFIRLARAVDVPTWLYHLENGDYARWFRDVIRDADLADEADRIARAGGSACERREAICDAIVGRYRAPVGA